MDRLEWARERYSRAEAELLGTVGAFVDWRRIPDAGIHVEHMAQRIEERFSSYTQASRDLLEAIREVRTG